MKTSRFVILLLLFLFASILTQAQQTVYYQSINPEIQKAKELYQVRNYISALNLFDQIALKSDENSDLRAEAMFYKALCGLKLDNGNAEEQIDADPSIKKIVDFVDIGDACDSLRMFEKNHQDRIGA